MTDKTFPLFENEFYIVSVAKPTAYNIFNKVTGVVEATENKFPTAVSMAKGLESATKRLMDNDNQNSSIRE